MRAVVQRVTAASVSVDGQEVGRIGAGLLVLLAVALGDTDTDLSYIVDKVQALRIFEDAEGRMNLDVREASAALLVVSQFTLLGDCRKGRRPSWDGAARPDEARVWYERALAAADGLELVSQEVARVAESLGDVCELFAAYDRAEAGYARAQELAADLVTAMEQVKHPFRDGVKAQKGIEF